MKSDHQDAAINIMIELENMFRQTLEERERFATMYTTEREKSKRLLFLFQKDLLPGLQGTTIMNAVITSLI